MTNWHIIIYSPAYNVEKPIDDFLKRTKSLTKSLEKRDISIFRLIIVEDASTDSTLEIINNFRKKQFFIEMISHRENKGAFNSVKEGMERALEIAKKDHLPLKNTIFIRIDTDMEHNPLEIENLVQPIKEGQTKVAVGLMDFKGYSIDFKEFNKHIGQSESEHFLGIKIPQFCPGFNAIRGDLFAELLPRLDGLSKKFNTKYGINLLTLDFVILVLAKKLGSNPSIIPLSPVPKKWIKDVSVSKLAKYLDYHNKTMEFLTIELTQK